MICESWSLNFWRKKMVNMSSGRNNLYVKVPAKRNLQKLVHPKLFKVFGKGHSSCRGQDR